MIVFRDAPFPDGTALVTIAAGSDASDALDQFGVMQDCIGCSTAVAAPSWTSSATIERVQNTFIPLSLPGPIIRPDSGAGGLLRRSGHWTEVDVDSVAQRLRKVRMPTELAGAQRLLAVNDLRMVSDGETPIAIGLWALFAHPVVRAGARFAGARDGLTAEIALAVHPDRYVLIESERGSGLTYVIATPDPIGGELMVRALRQSRSRFRGPGPWEVPLVQAATELGLGVRNSKEIGIDALVSPTLSAEQREAAAARIVDAAELIGVGPGN